MNWGKIVGIILAIIFILLYISTIQNSYYEGIQQINSFSNVSNDLKFSLVSFNKSSLIVNVKNPLNISIIICNISGKYLYLSKSKVILPYSNENLTLIITNFSGFVSNINAKNETIIIKIKILDTVISEETTL
ncbi:hypothetical protein [Sulfurisphaera tokodaii]|uniref:Uncharacterized protein n=2 Tax=Sulfurisphaera tokodaii TaxID=111955 RepID=Q970I5_SULTO|nr:hypothetical protein [Sulfurisphaera tokodaii]BAB66688.1 hypothetical protein STK_16100 [Sulfurisphaera tokodaii str. 7]HII73492.1 hypothetical protein [Sulfurisphaera tokodaii]